MPLTTQATANAAIRQPFYFRKNTAGSVEAADQLHSYFFEAGEPAAAAAPTPGLNGAALTSYAGQIPFQNPVSGNTYLWQWDVTSHDTAGTNATAQVSLLLDRLWHNSGIVVTTTTAQAITSPAFPARDRNGSADGEGLMIAIEVSAATTNAAAVTNMTVNYTNQAGTAGRTATLASFPATAVAGSFSVFRLADGDTGVRSIEGITLGTSLVTGTVHLVVFRMLDMAVQIFERNASHGGNSQRDMHSSGFVRLWDNTVPFVVMHPRGTTANANNLRGVFRVAQG